MDNTTAPPAESVMIALLSLAKSAVWPLFLVWFLYPVRQNLPALLEKLKVTFKGLGFAFNTHPVNILQPEQLKELSTLERQDFEKRKSAKGLRTRVAKRDLDPPEKDVTSTVIPFRQKDPDKN